MIIDEKCIYLLGCMDADLIHRGKRIARNTMMLYVRMLVLMLVGLYTSRVVLDALGETDYGIYSVVGGVVSMFTILSGSLSSAISRFITVELGKGDEGNLKSVFSTSVIIQLVLAVLIVAIAEPAGLWFIDNKMVLDPDRAGAARMVLHLSIITFAINLISIPYNAAIVAYEKMDAFAYISIFEGLAKLGVAMIIARSASDRLVLYSVLMCVIAVLVRVAYGIYCRWKLKDCVFSFSSDRKLFKEMSVFAGWNTIGVASSVCRDHGVNILLNLFFGPAVNAAKAIATQVNGAVYNFVRSFTTAVNPQITKSYVANDHSYMFTLIYSSARFSYFILLLICLPLILKTEYVLAVWLKDVPDFSVAFVRWTLLYVMSESLSNPLIVAQLATGKIRDYQIVVGGLQLLNLPVAYILLKMGYSPVSVMIASFVISQVCLFARLIMLRTMIGLNLWEYIRKVYIRVICVTVLATLLPLMVLNFFPDTFWASMSFIVICLVCVSVSVLAAGCTKSERMFVADKVRDFFKKGGRDDKH